MKKIKKIHKILIQQKHKTDRQKQKTNPELCENSPKEYYVVFSVHDFKRIEDGAMNNYEF